MAGPGRWHSQQQLLRRPVSGPAGVGPLRWIFPAKPLAPTQRSASAIDNVQAAIPGAVLTEMSPDLVNLADLGFVNLEQKTSQPLGNPFGPGVSPES